MDKYEKAVSLVCDFEGFRANAYYDSVGVVTIGYGTIMYANGDKVKIGDTCTKEEALEYMNDWLKVKVYPYVNKITKDWSDITDNTYAALCSFVYNEGSCGESVINAIANENLDDLANAFKKYCYAGGKPDKGLLNRRNKEIAYFMQKE